MEKNRETKQGRERQHREPKRKAEKHKQTQKNKKTKTEKAGKTKTKRFSSRLLWARKRTGTVGGHESLDLADCAIRDDKITDFERAIADYNRCYLPAMWKQVGKVACEREVDQGVHWGSTARACVIYHLGLIVRACLVYRMCTFCPIPLLISSDYPLFHLPFETVVAALNDKAARWSGSVDRGAEICRHEHNGLDQLVEIELVERRDSHGRNIAAQLLRNDTLSCEHLPGGNSESQKEGRGQREKEITGLRAFAKRTHENSEKRISLSETPLAGYITTEARTKQLETSLEWRKRERDKRKD